MKVIRNEKSDNFPIYLQRTELHRILDKCQLMIENSDPSTRKYSDQ